MNWNWDHIRYFLALAEHGTLSQAAKALGVSHSTVMRRIKAFEDQLNVHLFEHNNAGYSLTAAGKMLHSEASKMQGTLTALSREISGSDDELEGEVVITTTDTLARYVLPKLLAELSGQYPAIQFSLYMANELNDIYNHEADIAVRSCKQAPENLIGRKVGEIQFKAAASRSYVDKHELTAFPGSLNGHRAIMLNEFYASTPFYQWFEKRINNQGSVSKVNNFLCAAALAREGMGITVLPSYMLDKESNLIELKTADGISSNDLWVLSHSDLRDTNKVRVIRQCFYDKLSEFFQ